MDKKRITYVVVTVLLLNMFSPMLVSAKITDVPVDHWAYHSVNTAVNKGYLTFFEDGTFQGSRAVDRYTLASVIARLLEDIEAGRVKGTSGDLSLIRELSLDFEENLAKWYASQEAFKDELQKTRQNAVAAEERLSRVVSAQVDLEQRLDDVRGNINRLQEELAQVHTNVSNLGGQLSRQGGELQESEQTIEQLLIALSVLEQELQDQEASLSGIENWVGEKNAVFASMQSTDQKLLSEVASLRAVNQELEKDLDNLSVLLQWETKKRSELVNELENTKQELRNTHGKLVAMEDYKKQLSTDTTAQLNAALIREQRLERQIKSIEEEFASYRTDAEKNVKSAKTLAAVAIALAAVGAVVGFISK